MLDVDSPNLYAPFGWQAHTSTDPRGLVPIDLQSASREAREHRAEQRRQEMAKLLGSVEGYLGAHQDDSQAQLLAGLARHLKQAGFAGQTHEAVRLATSFLGRADCTAYLECHMDMAEGAIGVMEAIVVTSAMLAFTEIAALEVFAGPASTSYASMLQQMRAEIGVAQRLRAGLGDLTSAEVRQIQGVVDRAGRPLEVVGSAARGSRRGVGTDLPMGKGPGTRSDIDYLVPPSSRQYFTGFESQLPSLDPASGIIPGVHNPYIGPAIRFEPEAIPFLVPGVP